MSDDIVERLRAEAKSGNMPLGRSFDALAVADEIERLRAAGDALAHLMPHAHLSVPCRPPHGTPLDDWCSECAALAAWREARRER